MRKGIVKILLQNDEAMGKSLRFDSLFVHGGLETGPAGATAEPIVQSSSFAYLSAEGPKKLFRGWASSLSIPV
jgi:O-acetylhomoserine (thiol)-lyase